MKLPPCGAYCKNCIAYNKVCRGCVETDGKPFHLKGVDVCPIWQCALNRKLEHCGFCREFPCDKFLEWYDPRRGIVTSLRRAGLLALRKKIGTEAWLKWIEEKGIKFGVPVGSGEKNENYR